MRRPWALLVAAIALTAAVAVAQSPFGSFTDPPSGEGSTGGTDTGGTGTGGGDGETPTGTHTPETEGYGSGSADYYGYVQSNPDYTSPNNIDPVLPTASSFPTSGDFPEPPTFPPTGAQPGNSPAQPPSNINMMAQVNTDFFTYKFDGVTLTRTGFLTGINMGVGKPGYDPGSQAFTKADYTRLMNYAVTLNVNCIRVYTQLSSDFYDAFWELNQAREASGLKPIWVLHGIYTPNDMGTVPDGIDAFGTDNYNSMKSGIINLVNAVHGGGTIEWLPNIYNTYTTDVSKYIIGWAVGTEWYENDVNTTNVNNAGMAPYDGTYVATTSNASPFEIWCAQMLDFTAITDMQYNWQRPMGLTNWVTTDPIWHPLEPTYPTSGDDWMSVDATHMYMKSNWYAGYFITFHAYPYYPAFLNYAYSDYSSLIPDYPAAYPEVITPTDPYATYLERLRAYFDGYAIMITECGMPTSFGTSQFGFHTRDHGHNLEYDAYYKMNGVVTMIYDRRFAGLMYFSLMDEWFKKNWNNEKIDMNRAAWQNSFSSEQHFGMIAIEPERPVLIDGDASDWQAISPLYESIPPGPLDDFQLISATYDASYLYILVEKANGTDWTMKDEAMIAINSMVNQGSTQWKQYIGADFPFDADMVLFLNKGYMSLNLHTAADYYLRSWGAWLNPNLIPDPDALSGDTGRFNNMRALTKIPTVIGKTSQVFQDYFVQWAGDYPQGFTDPTNSNFSNFAMWNFNGNVLEARIPWQALGFADPASQLNYKLTGQGKGLVVDTMSYEGIEISALLLNGRGAAATSASSLTYYYDAWNYTCYCERYKNGVEQIAGLYAYLQSDKTNLTALSQPPYPNGTQFCECIDPTAGTWPLKGYYISAAYIIVCVFFGYAGLVRPLLERLVAGLVSSGSPLLNSRGRQQLQLISFMFFGIMVGTFLGVYYSPSNQTTNASGQTVYVQSMWEMLFTFCNPAGDMDSAGMFTLYIFLLSWDCIILLLASLLVRWRGPGPVPKEDLLDAGDDEDKDASPNKATAEESADQLNESQILNPPPEKPKFLFDPSDHKVLPYEVASKKFFFVIACHNSSAKIRATIEHLLVHVEPRQIVVADNGSTKREVRASRKLCDLLTQEYREVHPEYTNPNGVNYGHIQRGNKTLAQLSAAYNLLGHAEYITLLDDDTLLPPQFNLRKVLGMFEKDIGTQCVAYPLRAANRASSLCQMEDVEYLVAGFMKIVQAHCGTALFASGAFNTWRATTIVDILFRHDTMHNGDDLQQGLLLHSLAGQPYYLNPDIKHKGNYKVDVAEFLIGTDVPIHWVHARDVVPPFWPSRFMPSACSCGEPSLFYQRGKGWDVSRHRFLLKYFLTIINIQEWSFRSIFARVLAIYDTALILNDWAQLLYTLVIAVILPDKILLFHGLVGAWAIQMIVYSVFNMVVLMPNGLDTFSEVLVLFPILYKLPCIVFLRVYAMFYNLLYYLPFVRNKETIRKRLQNHDKATLDNIHSMAQTWDIINSTRPVPQGKSSTMKLEKEGLEPEGGGPSNSQSLASTVAFSQPQ